MRDYKRCNNAYYKCCYKPQENRLAYRFLYSRAAPTFLHPDVDTSGLERLIRTLVHPPNEKKRGALRSFILLVSTRHYNPNRVPSKVALALATLEKSLVLEYNNQQYCGCQI